MKPLDDTYGDTGALALSLHQLLALFQKYGADRVYSKPLSANDNSKNQIYLGASFNELNMLPVQELALHRPSSRKPKLKPGTTLVQGAVNFSWVSPVGDVYPAPHAKLILYPQYPEVRFSGFLLGSKVRAGKWFDVSKLGRSPNRHLVFGVNNRSECFGYLATPDSRISKELIEIDYISKQESMLKRVSPSSPSLHSSDRELLIEELRRIHLDSPIKSKRLSGGTVHPCKGPNCGGCTLEAELGIDANSIAGPDFHGWEIKSFSKSVLTLMTPEPDGGEYKEKGIDWFIRTYGYPDTQGRVDRINFGGVYRVGDSTTKTGLELKVLGYTGETGGIDLEGQLCLVAPSGTVASSWSFLKLLEHWRKKHNKAAYVRSHKEQNGSIGYVYDKDIYLGEGTDFQFLLDAFRDSAVYYDPGIKLEGASTAQAKTKRRSQFRTKFNDIGRLYSRWSLVDTMNPAYYPKPQAE